VKQADLGGIYSQRPPGVFFRASAVVVSPDLLSPTPLTSSAMKTQENTEEESDDPAPADKRCLNGVFV
jgi:hypothetical protein